MTFPRSQGRQAEELAPQGRRCAHRATPRSRRGRGSFPHASRRPPEELCGEQRKPEPWAPRERPSRLAVHSVLARWGRLLPSAHLAVQTPSYTAASSSQEQGHL